MSHRTLAVLAVIVFATLASIITYSVATNAVRKEGQIEAFDSPRIKALSEEIATGNRQALATFWKEVSGKAPVVEPIPGDDETVWVTFLWRGDPGTQRVVVLGGPPTGDIGANLLRLPNTDVWFHTDRIPRDARFIYRFWVDVPDKLTFDPIAEEKEWKENPPRQDPLNSNQFPILQGSLVELPGAAPQPWLPKSLVGLSGSETEHAVRGVAEFAIQSEILQQERTFAVYSPQNYDAQGGPYGLLVMFDGNDCQRNKDNPFPVAAILDNLIAEKKIPALVTVFVYQSSERNRELECSEPFADFVAKELIPRVQREYRVAAEPSRTIVCGFSLGGLMSAYCGFRHPEVFGNVLSLSGSYAWMPGLFDGTAPRDAEPGWLTRRFVASPQLAVRFFLAAGRFEHFYPYSLLGENRRFRDVLLAKGYSITFREFSGGHDPAGWRGPFVEGLMALTAGHIPPSPKTGGR